MGCSRSVAANVLTAHFMIYIISTIQLAGQKHLCKTGVIICFKVEAFIPSLKGLENGEYNGTQR